MLPCARARPRLLCGSRLGAVPGQQFSWCGAFSFLAVHLYEGCCCGGLLAVSSHVRHHTTRCSGSIAARLQAVVPVHAPADVQCAHSRPGYLAVGLQRLLLGLGVACALLNSGCSCGLARGSGSPRALPCRGVMAGQGVAWPRGGREAGFCVCRCLDSRTWTSICFHIVIAVLYEGHASHAHPIACEGEEHIPPL